MRIFFREELDTAATYWRVWRRDGVALGFTSHDRPLAFDGMVHRAAPGMVPAAIRTTSDLSEDNAGVEGALSHDSIRSDDLAAGLFDEAAIEVGIVDWETLDARALYSGSLGQIENDGRSFSAQLRSAKAILERDLVPRTSPTCRADFCGRGCNLSQARFTTRARLSAIDRDFNRVAFGPIDTSRYIDGTVRFLAGPQTGIAFAIVGSESGSERGSDEDWLVIDRPLSPNLELGTAAELREGCDHTLATCASRFDNAVNFRAEPFLPGNDLLARYGRGDG